MIHQRIKDGKNFILVDSYPLLPNSDGTHDDIDQVVVLSDGHRHFSVTLDSLRQDYQDVTSEYRPVHTTRNIMVPLSECKDENEMAETYDFYRNRTVAITKNGVDIFGIIPDELVEATLIDTKLSVNDSFGYWTAATVMPNHMPVEGSETETVPVLVIELFGVIFSAKIAEKYGFTVEDGKPPSEELVKFVRNNFRINEQFYQKKNAAGKVIEEQAYYNWYHFSSDGVEVAEFSEVDAVETPATEVKDEESSRAKH